MSSDAPKVLGVVVKPCRSLEEVRTNIDQLDDRIIDLIAERAAYVAQAARFKNSVDEAPAPHRAKQVLERIMARAGHTGLDPQVAEATYRAMIIAFIDWEARQIGSAH